MALGDGIRRNVAMVSQEETDRLLRAFLALQGVKYGGNRDDKPVVGVEIGYAIADDELVELTRVLAAFPQLRSLRLQSAKITDAELGRLKSLSGLRRLAVEKAAITDAGLVHLEALTHLEELNLKGTKVTEAGVQDFQKALPNAKVER